MKKFSNQLDDRGSAVKFHGDVVKRSAVVILFSVVLVATFNGCVNRAGIFGVDEHADIPAGAIPGGLGEKVCAWTTAQAANAAFDRQVFYRADFVGDSAFISPAAYRQFVGRAQNLAGEAPLAVFLEPSGNSEIDQSRIESLHSLAADLGLANVQILTGFPPALGLLGTQGERLGRAAAGIGTRGAGNANLGGGFGNSGTFGRSNTNVGGVF